VVALRVLAFSSKIRPAPGEGERVALELGVLGVGADAGQADEVALPAAEAEHCEGRGGDCGLCHYPQCLKTVS
jgi:hypothetical protein